MQGGFLSQLDDDTKLFYESRVALGKGEYLPIEWDEVEVEEYEVEEANEEGAPVIHKKRRLRLVDGKPVVAHRKEELYVGAMDMGTSGQLVVILGALLMDGMKLKEAFGRADAYVFVEFLGARPAILRNIIRAVTKLPAEFIEAEGDLAGWVFDVLAAWWRYNKASFFGLMQKASAFAGTSEINLDKMRDLFTPKAVAPKAETPPAES